MRGGIGGCVTVETTTASPLQVATEKTTTEDGLGLSRLWQQNWTEQ